MRKNQTSLTALGIAMNRAFESSRPEDERICFDPYARRMIPGWLYALGGFLFRTGYAEWRGPGVQSFLAVRDRFIDDFLSGQLSEGIDQLVLLGAGYDSRPYRFPGLEGKVAVFEVDHPATQQDKIERVKAIFGQVPRHVTFVPVDFTRQSLEQRLLECGYHPSRKTCFIWQGVIYYLDPVSVDGTLAFIAHRSGPGSSLVFDYLDRSVLEGAGSHGEIKGMRRYRRLTGEGLTFGIPDGTIEAFLSARGFEHIRDIDSEGLKERYFTGKNAHRKVVPGYGIVTARVAAPVSG